MSQHNYIITKYNYDILMWLAAVGGVAGACFSGFRVVVQIINLPIFMRGILDKIYMVKKRDACDEDKIT